MIQNDLKPLLITILFLFLLTTIAGCTLYSVDPRMFHSDYTYDMRITSDQPIRNATFIIPLPVKDNTPMIGTSPLIPDEFQKDNVKIGFTQSPKDLNLTNATIWEGYDPWYVIIQSDELQYETDDLWDYTINKKESIEPETSAFSTHTLYPKGNESVIMPKINFFWQNPKPSEIWPRNLIYNHPPVIQNTMVYAVFSAAPVTKTQIWFKIKDDHYWKQEYDAWMGNQYSDQFAVTISGEAKGWYIAEGKFSAAQGIYPNYDNPDWQKALNQTAEPERRSGMEIYDFILAFFRNKGN